jgi:monooxygenase
MFTLGYGWKPWDGKWAIAEGRDIWKYLDETAEEEGVKDRILYHHKVVQIDWRSDERRWHVFVERTDTGETVELTTDFFVVGTGYYDYDDGYTPNFPDIEKFKGQVVHPQHWPEDLDYAGKRIIVIGSGATAVTLIPSMARDAGHITMLQRTPTYVLAQPRIHTGAKLARRMMPRDVANRYIRQAYAAGTILGVYEWMRRYPALARKTLRKGAMAHLPADFDYDTHFNPPYNPWEQRLCVVPGADLFKALHSHKVDMVTDHIDRFTEKGILLKSGQELEADLIITATGLNVIPFGGAKASIDGDPVSLGDHFAYKALMINDVPNLVFLLGYSNASWTLKIDLVCDYLVRLLTFMDERNHAVVTPRLRGSMEKVPLMDLSSGYIQRAEGTVMWAGTRDPWRLKNNWYFDRRMIHHSPIDDKELEFS